MTYKIQPTTDNDWQMGGRVLILLRGADIPFHSFGSDWFRLTVPRFWFLAESYIIKIVEKRIIGDHYWSIVLCPKSFPHSVWKNAIRSICNMCDVVVVIRCCFCRFSCKRRSIRYWVITDGTRRSEFVSFLSYFSRFCLRSVSLSLGQSK